MSLARATGDRYPTACKLCGAVVVHEEVEHVSGPAAGRAFMRPIEHRAPCGRWCMRGGLRSEQAAEFGSMSKAVLEAHRAETCPSCGTPPPRPAKDPALMWGSPEWMRLYRAGIQKTEYGAFVISHDQVWRPGAFATEQAARMGQRLRDEEIQALQDAVNAQHPSDDDWPKRVITEEMIAGRPR